MTDRDMIKLARVATRRYSRRLQDAQRRDIEQEACAAMLRAIGRHQAARGTTEAQYLYPIARRTAVQWCWRYLGPVSQRWDRNAGPTYAAPVDREMVEERLSPEDAVDRQRLIGRLAEILAAHPIGASVLLGERPAHVAQRLQRPVREIYAATERARRQLRDELGGTYDELRGQ